MAAEDDAPRLPLPAAVPLRGQTFGRYFILDPLGAGAMGEVFSAYHPDLDRKVAIKVLKIRDPEYEARLTREAQAMARLMHPNVVAVYDAGVADGQMYIAMELVQGTTLRAWSKETPRTAKEVVRVYAQAAQGLIAAHAAGLVHRDFKPDNVLIGVDGAVKVADFGIARSASEVDSGSAQRRTSDESPGEAPVADDGDRATPVDHDLAVPEVQAARSESVRATTGSGSLGTSSAIFSPLTEHGTVLGTPGYMAPEQYLAEPVDARTDQFAFCVALYEALYGKKPFGGRSLMERSEATLLGKVRPPPKGSKVPGHLRRVLLRGLSTERAARYASMEVLLKDLLRDRARERRRVGTLAAALLGIGVAVVAGQRVLDVRRANLCAGGEEDFAEIWSSDVAQATEAAFARTGVPYAAAVWRQTHQQIERFRGAWVAAHRQTCEATRLRGEQSEAVMTAQMVCLDRQREGARALLHLFAEADDTVVSQAVQAAAALDVESCKNVASLTEMKPEPAEPATRGQIEALRVELAGVKASANAGRQKAAQEQATSVLERARKINYEPLLAEALEAAGNAADTMGDNDIALRDAEEAVDVAELARADSVKVRVESLVSRFAIYAGNIDVAETWARLAESTLSRYGSQGDTDGRLAVLQAKIALTHYEGAREPLVALIQQKLDLVQQDPVSQALTLSKLSQTESDLGRYEIAKEHMGRALNLMSSTVGNEHPILVEILNCEAWGLSREGRYRESLESNARSIDLAKRLHVDWLPPYSLAIECDDLRHESDAAATLGACQSALEAGRQAFKSEGVMFSLIERHVARGYLAAGRFKEAEELARGSVDYYESSLRKKVHSIYLAYGLTVLGLAQLKLEKLDQAAATLERAISVWDEAGASCVDNLNELADAQLGLAQALSPGANRSPRVASLVAQAASNYRSIRLDREARAAEDWLANGTKK